MNRIIVICMVVLLNAGCVFSEHKFNFSSAVSNEYLLEFMQRGFSAEPQEAYEVPQKNLLRMKKNGCGFSFYAFSHRNTAGTKYQIKFNHRTTAGKSGNIMTVSFRAIHVDIADNCNGSAPERFFDFKFTSDAETQIFTADFSPSENDIICRQCGKILSHALLKISFYPETLLENSFIDISDVNIFSDTSFILWGSKQISSQSFILQRLQKVKNPPEKVPEKPQKLENTVLELSMQKKAEEDYRNQTDAANSARLAEFIPIAEKFQSGNHAGAIADAEKIAEQNNYCAVMLYLIYSRGYAGAALNYAKAAKYLNQMFGTYLSAIRPLGFSFYSNEYHHFWKKLRFIATDNEKQVKIRSWNALNQVMDEIFLLKGKYLLKDCYEENMLNSGGIIGRTFYETSIGAGEKTFKKALSYAVKYGNGRALVWPFDATLRARESGVASPEDYKGLAAGSAANYIPAKLWYAELLLKNNHNIPLDPELSRKLLLEIIDFCSKYEQKGCTHARKDLERARLILKFIPDSSLPTEKLLKQWEKCRVPSDNSPEDMQKSALEFLLANRNDHPSCDYFRAMRLPEKSSDRHKLYMKAAENGCLYSLRYILQCEYNSPDYWYWLYLGGKYKLPYFRHNNESDLFKASYFILQEKRWQISPDKYKKAIEMLAPYNSTAKKEYEALIASGKVEFSFKCSDSRVIQGRMVERYGHKFPLITSMPSEKEQTVEINITNVSKRRGMFFPFAVNSRESNISVNAELFCNGKSVGRVYAGDSYNGNFPDLIKVKVAPRRNKLEFELRFELLP